jgi:hypothetical protein
MKLLRSLLLLVSFLTLLSACQKEESLEHASNLVTNSQWEFKDSISQFRGPMDTAYIANAGPMTSLVLNGTSIDGQGEIFIQIFSNTPIAKGAYTNPNVLFNYIVGGSLYFENVPANVGKFSVTITSIDSLMVEGTFSGEVLDVLGNTKTLREGKFKAYFQNAVIPPPPAGNGQLMLWSKEGCNGGAIRVKVLGQEKSITSFQATEPVCGAGGTVLYVLPAGQYTWEAICGTDTIRGSAGIVAGACIRAEVILQPATGANCALSDYTAFDPGSNTMLFGTKSFFNASNKVNKIQFFEADPANGTFEYNLVHEPNKITIQEGQQFFELDQLGRVSKFHGFVQPSDPTSFRVIYSYIYDVSGRMARATIALESNPNQPVLESLHTWNNGNLTKVVIKQIGAMNERTEIDYEYDLTKQTNKFLLFFANEELMMFQTAINVGVNSVNAVTKSTVRDYDQAGAVTPYPPATFSNYTIDANKYVKSFSIGDGVSVYAGDVNYTLTYKCF